MSVATALDPHWDAVPNTDWSPVPSRSTGRSTSRPATCSPRALATVTTLHRPPAATLSSPLRLTRRGVHVVGAALAVLALALVWVARLSAPAATPTPARPAPDTVTVRSGDTLWSIATRLTPQGDPRAEVADLQRLNRLHGAAVVPGQVLRTH